MCILSCMHALNSLIKPIFRLLILALVLATLINVEKNGLITRGGTPIQTSVAGGIIIPGILTINSGAEKLFPVTFLMSSE